MTSVFASNRPDPSPYPDLPILFIVGRQSTAKHLQRFVHPCEIFFQSACGPLSGRRFRLIMMSDAFRHEAYLSQSQVERGRFQRWIDEAMSKLAPGCPKTIVYV